MEGEERSGEDLEWGGGDNKGIWGRYRWVRMGEGDKQTHSDVS